MCLSVDDVHPATSNDSYEAGGDLSRGALGRIERLLERHAKLKVTLFVTPDWRPVQLVTTRYLARVPYIANHVYHVDLHRKGRFRVDRYPAFVAYLNTLPRTEIAPHGLHHVHRGAKLAVEFQEQSQGQCLAKLRRALRIFDAAGLAYVNGFAPPGWNLPASLRDALDALDFDFVASARDLCTAIAPRATSRMSGLSGVSLIAPERIAPRGLVHLPTNFQATSSFDRADRIVACGGLISIKAHAFKRGGGHVLADGMDDNYFAYLDALFAHLERRHGDSLWWASMSEIAARFRDCEMDPRALRLSLNIG